MKFVSKPFIFFILFLSLLFTFNISIVKDIFAIQQDVPGSERHYVGDGIITEYISEKAYDALQDGRNPFDPDTRIMYPFTLNLSMVDPGLSFGYLFLLIRPFFDSYQSLLVIVLLSFTATYIFTYLYARQLGLKHAIAFLISVAFTFNPFVSQRLLGHYTYVPMYVLPMALWLLGLFYQHRQVLVRSSIAVLFGASVGWAVITNFQYALITIIAVVIVAAGFYTHKNISFVKIFDDLSYGIFSAVGGLIVTMQWIQGVIDYRSFGESFELYGLKGAPDLSTDILSIVVPGERNPLYAFLASQNPIISEYFFSNGMSFGYGGLLVLLGLGITIFSWRNVPDSHKQTVKPFLIASGVFLLLMLGPFLKFAGHWRVPLEGIHVYVPLPFLIFHFIPGLENLRVPSRFIVGYTFFGLMVSGLLMQHVYLNAKSIQRNALLLFMIMFTLVFLDQMYVIPEKIYTPAPMEIYKHIREDPNARTVLEIPFAVRDGFQYRGDVHGLATMKGAIIHDKNSIGGYVARVHPDVFRYYEELPFLGYILDITDKGNFNPYREPPKKPTVYPFEGSLEEAKRELDFLDVTDVVLKRDEIFSESVEKLLGKLEFEEKVVDGQYVLFSRVDENTSFINADFGTESDLLHTGIGFSVQEMSEEGIYRWAQQTEASVFFNSHIEESELVFTAQSFDESQNVDIFIDKHFIQTVFVREYVDTYEIEIDDLPNGLHTVYFSAESRLSPNTLDPNNLDTRELSIKFFDVALNEE